MKLGTGFAPPRLFGCFSRPLRSPFRSKVHFGSAQAISLMPLNLK